MPTSAPCLDTIETYSKSCSHLYYTRKQYKMQAQRERPRKDVEPYIPLAEARGLTALTDKILTYILESEEELKNKTTKEA